MKYQDMSGLRPALGWQQFAELLFYAHRCTGNRPTQSAGNTADMSVHHHPRDIKSIAQNHVRRFTADSGQVNQLGQLLRYYSIMRLQQLCRTTNQIFSLIAEEPG